MKLQKITFIIKILNCNKRDMSAFDALIKK